MSGWERMEPAEEPRNSRETPRHMAGHGSAGASPYRQGGGHGLGWGHGRFSGQPRYLWLRTEFGWNLCSSVSFSSPTPRPACSDIRLARVCGLETTPQAHWKLIGILHFRFFGAASRLSPICRLV